MDNMNNNKKKLDISAPWVLFYKELLELFRYDPEIEVRFYDADENIDGMPTIEILVESLDKANALNRLLPTEIQYGAVTIKIVITPPNYDNKEPGELIKRAFKGNSAFVGTEKNDVGTYAVFTNRVVQYFTDNLGDIHGNRSTLYEEIAREVFGDVSGVSGVFFCTDSPLGEWLPFPDLDDSPWNCDCDDKMPE